MKRLLIIIVCIFLFFGCEQRKLDTVYSYDDTLKFIDENGYMLSLHYSDDLLISAEWVIVTKSEEKANKLLEYYSDKIDMFDVSSDEKTVILNYTEEYMDESFGGITKSEMEKYLKDKGYEFVEE